MDRISTLRNIEEALAEFESGELTLPELEMEVRGILRTYATDFDEQLSAYRASGDAPADGLVVVAESRTKAREQIDSLLGESPGSITFDLERVQ